MSEPSRINKTPGVCGGEACIRDTRHTVAGLVEWRRLGLSDEGILQRHPDLTLDDLQAAWAYYEAHKAEIDDALTSDGKTVPGSNGLAQHLANQAALLTPELLEWARQQISEEEIIAGLEEIRRTGGLELKDFIDELEQEARTRERSA
jgi:type III restriction enzyme